MIAVVVPTIREECFKKFIHEWKGLFLKHKIQLIKVEDGESPVVTHYDFRTLIENGVVGEQHGIDEIAKENKDLIYCKNDGVRNLGFLYISEYLKDVSIIITLDDDCYPIKDTDPIQEHIDALNMRVPISWISTASEYMRGFPYGIREEAEVVLSHGVWDGVKDWDAPTQLTYGNRDVTFYKGVVPKGILFPMCIMNVAFKRKILPFMYQAPAYGSYQRFSDIWCGIHAKRDIDTLGYAVVTGYSKIYHSRVSDVFVNLKKEAKGIGVNEHCWKEGYIIPDEHKEYFSMYQDKRMRWKKIVK